MVDNNARRRSPLNTTFPLIFIRVGHGGCNRNNWYHLSQGNERDQFHVPLCGCLLTGKADDGNVETTRCFLTTSAPTDMVTKTCVLAHYCILFPADAVDISRTCISYDVMKCVSLYGARL